MQPCSIIATINRQIYMLVKSAHCIPALFDSHDQYINDSETMPLVKQKLREFHAKLQTLGRL